MSKDALLQEVLKTPLMPVIVINDLSEAEPLAQALVAGGINTLEITMRTEAAIPAIKLLREKYPELLVGVGSVTSVERYKQAVEAGAQFIISPGATDAIYEEFLKHDVPFIPGVSNASEVMKANQYGIYNLKFFPAELNGGAKALQAISAPLPESKFCPTGGIGLDNMESYLKLPCVTTIGGSWILPKDLVANKDWEAITKLTKDTVLAIKEVRAKYGK